MYRTTWKEVQDSNWKKKGVILGEMNIPSTQILVSTYISHQKELQLLGETAASRTGAGQIQDKCGISWVRN